MYTQFVHFEGQGRMFNPNRLAHARKRRGWTLTALAAKTELSREILSRYENGGQVPADATLVLLAETLDVNERFLAGPDLEEIPVDAVSFRALSKMTNRTRDQGLASGRIALLIDEWIGRRFNLPKADLPTLTGRDPETAAEELRARWGLGQHPIKNVVHLLEAHGVRVYSLTDDNTNLDAYSLIWNKQPYVFLSTNKSGERSRFDAAHELGHLILHAESTPPHGPVAEQQANRFAAAFLMPRCGVIAQGLRNAGLERILVAKQRWNVAAVAMAHRANELGLMSEWGYRSLCVDLSRRGYRRGEPKGIARESSKLLTEVLNQLRADGVSIATIATEIGLTAAEVKAHLFGLTPTIVQGGATSSSPTDRSQLHLVE